MMDKKKASESGSHVSSRVRLSRPLSVGILTIWSANLGNRLQNYAMQCVLEGLGARPFTLRREVQSVSKRVKRWGRRFIRRDRLYACRRFDDGYVRFADDVVAQGQVAPNLEDSYDRFVIGSDQVWNPGFSFNSDAEYLPFVSAEKKLAYAASFGVGRLDGYDKGRIARLLQGIGSIAMRERSGALLVGELTGRDVPVVLDPVMLVRADEWRRLATVPEALLRDGEGETGGDFVLKYFIGRAPDDDATSDVLSCDDAMVVDAGDTSGPWGPCELLWLIDHARSVCTDSFHATALCLLLHRPFVLLARQSADEDMSTRLASLIGTFDVPCERRACDGREALAIEEVDWDAIDARLGVERRQSLAWLSQSLELPGWDR